MRKGNIKKGLKRCLTMLLCMMMLILSFGQVIAYAEDGTPGGGAPVGETLGEEKPGDALTEGDGLIKGEPENAPIMGTQDFRPSNPPKLEVDEGKDRTIVKGDQTELGGDPTVKGGTSPHTIVWSVENGDSDSIIGQTNSNNPTVSPVKTTEYKLVVTDSGQDNNKQSDIKHVTVTVTNLKVDAGGGRDGKESIEVGTKITLGGNPTAWYGKKPYSYVWSSDPVDTTLTDDIIDHSNPEVTPHADTTYTVNVTDANGNTASDSVTVELYGIKAFAGPDIAINKGESVQLGGLPAVVMPHIYDDMVVEWTSSTNPEWRNYDLNPSVEPTEETVYTLTAKAYKDTVWDKNTHKFIEKYRFVSTDTATVFVSQTYPELHISKYVNKVNGEGVDLQKPLPNIYVNDELTYEVLVINQGTGAATGISMVDQLPSGGLEYLPDFPHSNNLVYSSEGKTLTLNNVEVPAGGSAAFYFTARAAVSGSIKNYAYITNYGDNDINSGNHFITVQSLPDDSINDTHHHTTTAYKPDLVVVKTVDKADVNVGDLVSFTINVKNIGNTDASSVVMNDVIPEGLEHQFDNSGGAFDKATGKWTIGNLSAGQDKNLMVTCKVTKAGTLINTATTSCDNQETNMGNNTSSITLNAKEKVAVTPPVVIPETQLPGGPPSLPKTGGIPPAALSLSGLMLLAAGFGLKKKSK